MTMMSVQNGMMKGIATRELTQRDTMPLKMLYFKTK